jgi:hypothetical protein
VKALENMVLRKMCGSRKDEVTEGWRKLHNEELLNLYSTTNMVRMIKSRRTRWAGHAARMGSKRNAYKIWLESQKERDRYEDQDIGACIILQWILEI